MGRPFQLPEPGPVEFQRGQDFTRLVELMRRLLAEDGCPWDRQQDYKSLRRFVLEEACEVIDAIDAGDAEQLKEELGDLALQVIFLAELARRDARFGPDDVVRAVCEKLIRRHPHVFGDTSADTAGEVVRNWEAIKQTEKQQRGVLDGVPRSLPALDRAQRMSDRASRVGFDWPDARGPRAKVDEELRELDAAIKSGDSDRVEHELGDLLFAVVNLARHHGLDAELALRRTAHRFAERFRHVEARVKQRHGQWPRGEHGEPAGKVLLQELDQYWEEAKRAGT